MEPFLGFEKDILRRTHDLAVAVYNATRDFPISESKGLTYELRQSALAINAFLSDALRKYQKPYLLQTLDAVQRHLQTLRRDLAVAQLLLYVRADRFQGLDEAARLAEEDVLRWRGALDGEISLRLPPAPASRKAPVAGPC